MARDAMSPGEFIEVYVDTSLEEAERRDPKGLYKKARQGQIKHFTGIDSPYEPPLSPEVRIDTLALSPEQAVELLVQKLRSHGRID
jgi:bifunctional enzyme CysN/CysC